MSSSSMEYDPVSSPDETLRLSETALLIEALTGLLLTAKEQPKLQAFVQDRLSALGFTHETQYCDRLKASYQKPSRHAQEWSRLINVVTNGESYFFRDPEQLALIRNTLLPELIEQRRRSFAEGLSDRLYLNLWSAGCSSGEEPYSLAMILRELLPDIEDWQINLIATDINPSAISHGKAGLYREWSLRGLDPSLRQRFFTPLGQQWQISPELQSMIQWSVLNLKSSDAIAHRIPWASMDLILCRNVFIYFGPAAIGQIMRNFEALLSPEGYIVIGHAELEGQDLSFLHPRYPNGSVIYQRLSQETTPSQNPAFSAPRSKPTVPLSSTKLITPLKQKSSGDCKKQLLDPHVQWIQAKAAFTDKQWQNAKTHAQQVLKHNTQHVEALMMLVDIALVERNWAQTSSLIRKIIYIHPHHLIAHVKLMNLYELMGNLVKRDKILLTIERLVESLPATQKINYPQYRTVGELRAYITWKRSLP